LVGCLQFQALLDVPGHQPPLLISAQSCNLREGILMLVTLDPDAGEASLHKFEQPLRK
jgi:hypothetical protein